MEISVSGILPQKTYLSMIHQIKILFKYEKMWTIQDFFFFITLVISSSRTETTTKKMNIYRKFFSFKSF